MLIYKGFVTEFVEHNPFAFEGKLIQYIGRIQHSENPPVIFDYRDSKIDYFEKMFKQRHRYYKKLTKEVNV